MRLRLPRNVRRSRRPDSRSPTRCCPRTAPGPGSPVCRWAARCRTESWPTRPACTAAATVRPRAAATAASTVCTNGPPRKPCCAWRSTAPRSSSTSPCSAPTSVSNSASATPASASAPPPSAPVPAGRGPSRSPTRAGAGPVGAPWPPRARAVCGVVRPSRSPRSPGWPGTDCGWWRAAARTGRPSTPDSPRTSACPNSSRRQPCCRRGWTGSRAGWPGWRGREAAVGRRRRAALTSSPVEVGGWSVTHTRIDHRRPP